MPRNASGNFTLPLPPVVTGTVIESLWANTTMNDLAASITDSLDRYGRGGMVAPFRMVDGTVSTPAISFSSETNTGLYKPSAGVVSLSVLGAEVQTWTSAATTIGVELNLLGDFNILGGVEVDGSVLLADDEWLAWGSAVPPFGPYITGSNVTDVMKFSTNSLERLRITANGNVGIGTPTPLEFSTYTWLSLVGRDPSTGGGIQFRTSDDVHKGYINNSNTVFQMVNESTTTPMTFWTNGAERVRIDTSGFVGINCTPIVRTHIKGLAEIFRIETTQARGGGNGFLSFYDPTGRKGYLGYGAADDNFYVNNEMSGAMLFLTTGLERMRITPAGLIGIGMDPVVALDCAGAVRANNGADSILLDANSLYVRWFKSGVADFRAQVDSGGVFWLTTNAGTLARQIIDNSGNICLGDVMLATGTFTVRPNLGGARTYPRTVWNTGTNGADVCDFQYNGTQVGRIHCTSTATAYITSSDARLKQDIVDLDEVGDVIDALRAREFAFKVEADKRVRGLIAQEVIEVVPEIVSKGDDWWGIDYGRLTPLLLREIQSLRARVAALEA